MATALLKSLARGKLKCVSRWCTFKSFTYLQDSYIVSRILSYSCSIGLHRLTELLVLIGYDE